MVVSMGSTALFIAFGMAAASQPAPQLHCIGHVAHLVINDGTEGNLVVKPVPERSAACAVSGLEGERGGDKLFCLGVNQDSNCVGPKRDALPMPFDLTCKGCFAAATTDVFYSVNMTYFRLHHVGVGFRGTHLHSTVNVMGDKGNYKPKQGSITLNPKPLEHKIVIAGKVIAEFNLSMPTELFYEFTERAGEHMDAGAVLDVDLGENSIQYTEGKGWSHHSDKARVKVQPLAEGTYNTQTDFTVGVKSQLEVNVSRIMWFRASTDFEVPLMLTSTGTSASDLVHTCASGGLNFDMRHEADLNIEHPFQKKHHWGPKVDRHSEHPDLFKKCFDVHPKRPIIVV